MRHSASLAEGESLPKSKFGLDFKKGGILVVAPVCHKRRKRKPTQKIYLVWTFKMAEYFGVLT
jgi:hypothetical protein